MREFHVDRLCEMYSLTSTGFDARIGVSIDSDKDGGGRNGSASSIESRRDIFGDNESIDEMSFFPYLLPFCSPISFLARYI